MTARVPCHACGEVEQPSPLSPNTLFPEPDGRWRCARCKRVFHDFCSGAADDLPHLCDDCWCKVHRGDAA